MSNRHPTQRAKGNRISSGDTRSKRQTKIKWSATVIDTLSGEEKMGGERWQRTTRVRM